MGFHLWSILFKLISIIIETPAAFPDTVKEKETPTPGEDIHLESSIPHTDSGIGEEQVANILNGA